MAELFTIGLSHRTAVLAVREKLAVSTESLAGEVTALLDDRVLREVMLISTCNRVEIYGTVEDPVAGVARARRYFDQRGGGEKLDGALYEHWGAEAARHAFRVAASLDSMVVGEPQILGQVKEAYEAASAAGGIGTLLGRCMSHAFAVAKRVRSETAIAAGSVSVSSIACDLATKIFGDLRGRRALLVGAGEMGEAAAKSLAGGGSRLVVVNRSPEKAEELARECGGEPRGIEHLYPEMITADVVITSTSSDRFVITPELMHDVIRARKRRPIFLIDIAVPRDVDPRVGQLENVFLYDVDDLTQVAEENMAARRAAAAAAEALVEEEVLGFDRWRRSLSLTPTIVALRERFREVVRGELERTLPRLGSLGERERQALDKMCDAMVNKLLHQPLSKLKGGAAEPDGALLIDAAQRLFDLPAGDAAGAPATAAEAPSAAEEEVVELAAAAGRSGKRT
jgi:glutamyl-tRNA reductase